MVAPSNLNHEIKIKLLGATAHAADDGIQKSTSAKWRQGTALRGRHPDWQRLRPSAACVLR